MGAAELVVLVLGLPLALQRFGALGFFVALGAVVLLCLTIFTALFFSARSLGRRWRWAFPFLSPFAAPKAAEALLEEAGGGGPPPVVGRALRSVGAVLAWMWP